MYAFYNKFRCNSRASDGGCKKLSQTISRSSTRKSNVVREVLLHFLCNMWPATNNVGIVALSLLSMMIVAGNGRDAENCGVGRCGVKGAEVLTKLNDDNNSAGVLNIHVGKGARPTGESGEHSYAKNIITMNPSIYIDIPLMKNAILYGLLSEIVEVPSRGTLNITDVCLDHSRQLFEGINKRHLWALKGNSSKSLDRESNLYHSPDNRIHSWWPLPYSWQSHQMLMLTGLLTY